MKFGPGYDVNCIRYFIEVVPYPRKGPVAPEMSLLVEMVLQ